MKKQQGFTLIELLVVIAIIGILSSVVLASLNTARDKGQDAAIKANLANARAQAELYYDDNGNKYEVTNGSDSVCVVSDGILASKEAAEDASGTTATCNDSATAWAMQATLSDGSYFCVDNKGSAATSSTALSTNTVCP